jgi:hypothetical protein
MVLKEETSITELTEFHWVEPSPFDIRTKEEGMNPFVGVLANRFRIWSTLVSRVAILIWGKKSFSVPGREGRAELSVGVAHLRSA